VAETEARGDPREQGRDVLALPGVGGEPPPPLWPSRGSSQGDAKSTCPASTPTASAGLPFSGAARGAPLEGAPPGPGTTNG